MVDGIFPGGGDSSLPESIQRMDDRIRQIETILQRFRWEVIEAGNGAFNVLAERVSLTGGTHPWKMALATGGVSFSPGFILGYIFQFASTGTITPDGPDSVVCVPIGYHNDTSLVVPATETGYLYVRITRGSNASSIYSDCDSDGNVFIQDIDQVFGTFLGEEVTPYFSTTSPDAINTTAEYKTFCIGKITFDGDTVTLDQYLDHNPLAFLPVTMVESPEVL